MCLLLLFFEAALLQPGEQGDHALAHILTVVQFAVEPYKGHEPVLSVNEMLVEAIGLAQLSFDTVALVGAVEVSLGHADKHLTAFSLGRGHKDKAVGKADIALLWPPPNKSSMSFLLCKRSDLDRVALRVSTLADAAERIDSGQMLLSVIG